VLRFPGVRGVDARQKRRMTFRKTISRKEEKESPGRFKKDGDTGYTRKSLLWANNSQFRKFEIRAPHHKAET